MAVSTRMAFICKDNKLYFKYYTFEYYNGFAISQKRKSIESFHNIIKNDGINNILEVSRKNENIIGQMLSAFNLMIKIGNDRFPVECLYQSSKVFGNIQFKQCLTMHPIDAKRYIKEKVKELSLSLSEFRFNEMRFPLNPKSLFYDYLYIWALNQNNSLANEILNYDCFTDIEFNHKNQFASQARSCALFKYLFLNNEVEEFLKKPFLFEDLYRSLQENLLV